MHAAISAIIETKPSTSIAPKPIIRMSFSELIILGVVPEDINAWKPDIAPHAMVMNIKGKSFPGITGPPPSIKFRQGRICRFGAIKITPTASNRIVPIFI